MLKVVDYPSGDGNPNCKECHGRGVVVAPPRPGSVIAGGRTVPCECVIKRDILFNVERGWRGLSSASVIPTSPLVGLESTNLRVTGSQKSIREHLRHVAVRRGPRWMFNVVSDSDLMDSWLARIEDQDVIDADVGQLRRQPVTSKYGALVDLVEPPELLIIIVGVKAARNSAMPEVMAEALKHRAHLNKITWIVDQPEYLLATGHISYSDMVGAIISLWKKVSLDGKQKESVPQLRHRVAVESTPFNRVTGIQKLEMSESVDERSILSDEFDRLDSSNSKKKWGKR